MAAIRFFLWISFLPTLVLAETYEPIATAYFCKHKKITKGTYSLAEAYEFQNLGLHPKTTKENEAQISAELFNQLAKISPQLAEYWTLQGQNLMSIPVNNEPESLIRPSQDNKNLSPTVTPPHGCSSRVFAWLSKESRKIYYIDWIYEALSPVDQALFKQSQIYALLSRDYPPNNETMRTFAFADHEHLCKIFGPEYFPNFYQFAAAHFYQQDLIPQFWFLDIKSLVVDLWITYLLHGNSKITLQSFLSYPNFFNSILRPDSLPFQDPMLDREFFTQNYSPQSLTRLYLTLFEHRQPELYPNLNLEQFMKVYKESKSALDFALKIYPAQQGQQWVHRKNFNLEQIQKWMNIVFTALASGEKEEEFKIFVAQELSDYLSRHQIKL